MLSSLLQIRMRRLCSNLLRRPKLQLGVKVTEGLGAGAKPEIGAHAAAESIEEIVDRLAGSHMCFITAGMGGGTGTGAAPVIAKAAREMGILTVGVVTKPFQFEGAKRMAQAEHGVEELQRVVDTLIIIPNQNLFRLANEKTTFTEAFSMADDVLYQGVKGVTDLMVRPGIINLDFADIRSVMDEMGKAMMGTGEGNGENRAIEAAEKAIANPLLDEISLKGAKGVLINITGAHDLTLFELDEAANRIRAEVDPEANIIVGSTLDDACEGMMRVSVVATGIDASDVEQAPATPKRTVADVVAEEARNRPTFESQRQPLVVDPAPAAQPAEPQTAPATQQPQEPQADQLAEQPAPQFSPAPRRVEATDAVKQRLQDAVAKMPEGISQSPAQADDKSGRFAINSLIHRMTGGRDEPYPERKEPSMDNAVDPDPIVDAEERDKADIPAFLRRQAN